MTAPTETQLAGMVTITPDDPILDTWQSSNGCVAWIEKSDRRCGREAPGYLCGRHEAVARRRWEKAITGKRRATYDDLTDPVTIAVGELADMLATAEHQHGITVRLLSATIATSELRGIQRHEDGRVWLCIGHNLNNARYSGGVYRFLDPGSPVHVRVAPWAPTSFTDELTRKIGATQ